MRDHLVAAIELGGEGPCNIAAKLLEKRKVINWKVREHLPAACAVECMVICKSVSQAFVAISNHDINFHYSGTSQACASRRFDVQAEGVCALLLLLFSDSP